MTQERTTSRRAALARLALATTMTGAAVALAAGLALANDPILHEFFIIPIAERGGPSEPNTVDLNTGDDGANEAAAALSDALDDQAPEGAVAPPLTIENQGDELELTNQGAPITPSGESASQHNGPPGSDNPARLDRNTTLDQDLSYFSVFNPSVVPWKRGGARDAVSARYELYVRDRQPRPLRVQDRPVREGYERFWASLLVHMEEGKQLPIPSPAPDVNILRYQTEPPTFLTFYRDQADNYTMSGSMTGTVRINIQMEAPSAYFGGSVDPSLQVGDLAPRHRPRLPAPVRKAAERAIAQMNIPTEGSFKEQLEALVAYFRAFEAREFPMDEISEDIYLDLTLNQIGVCRHRAFAFVITAQALGIMARYVYNEAHAFVEVKIPRQGWLRVDLGGAAVNFEVHNSSDKMLHTPPEPDTLPRPDGYTQSYSHNLGNGQHEADVDGDGDWEPMEGVPDQMSGDGTLLGPQDEPQGLEPGEGGDAASSTEGGDGAAAGGPPADMAFPAPAPDADGAANPTPTRTPRKVQRATITSVIEATPSPGPDVFRGETLQVEGKLTSAEGTPLPDKPVEAFLAPKGDYRVEAFVPIGTGRTDSQGRVVIDARLPKSLALGRWSLYLYFRGEGGLAPSHSE